MKTCAEHHFAYDEALGNCPHCEMGMDAGGGAMDDSNDPGPAEPPSTAGTHALDPAEPPPAGVGAARAPGSAGRPSAPPAEAAKPAEPAPREPGARKDDPPPGGQASAREAAGERASSTGGPAQPAGEDTRDEDTKLLDKIDELRRKGIYTVAMIGFYAGGKTWFLNRLKYELMDRFDLAPPPAAHGEEVPRSTSVTIHYVRRRNREREIEVFAIVDIPGENLRQLVSHNFTAVKSLIAAIQMCGAMIVALPADEVLLSAPVRRLANRSGGSDQLFSQFAEGQAKLTRLAELASELVEEFGGIDLALAQVEKIDKELDQIARRLRSKRGRNATVIANAKERRKVIEEQRKALIALMRVHRLAVADTDLTDFINQLCFLTGLVSKLSAEGATVGPDFDFASIDVDAVNDHIMPGGGFTPFERPTYVALTKADMVREPKDEILRSLIRSCDPEIGRTFDRDPLDAVRAQRRGLIGRFEQWFETFKVDFVTAFHGQDVGDVIDYDLEHVGVDAVLHWIFWAQQWSKLSPADRAAMARARRLRAFRDSTRPVGEFHVPVAPAGEGN